MRPILPLLLAFTTLSVAPAVAADAPPPAPAPLPAAMVVPDDATRIAADIIKTRALDAAAAGQQELAVQLQALARGLLEGRVTLYDASLVMQIAATPRGAAAPPAAAPMTAEARAGAQRAAALLDGTGPAASASASPTSKPGTIPPATATSADPVPLALPTMPPVAVPSKAPAAKVYAVDNGSDGKANVAAIGVGSNNGVVVGQIFTIKRKGQQVAQCKIVKVQPSLCYGEVIKGSLVDPKDDIQEGDQATPP